MILTNAQMLDSLRILTQVEETGVLGFAVMQNRRKLQTEVREYSDKHDELLKKHGTDLGDGRVSLPREAVPAFEAELRPYAELTADVPVTQVTVEVFCSGNLTSGQMYALAWMVKEG